MLIRSVGNIKNRQDIDKMEKDRFDDMDSYIRLAKKLTKKYYGNGVEYALKDEDFISDAAYELMTADWNWKREKSSKFYNRKRHMQWFIQDFKTYKHNRQKLPKECTYSGGYNEEELRVVDKSIPEHIININNEHTRERLARLNPYFTQDQRDFIEMYFFQGKSVKEIAEINGVSTYWTYLVRAKIINTLKEHIDEKFFK